jgi:hypothetical protein
VVFSFTVLAAYTAWLSHRAGGDWWVESWVIALEYGAVLVALGVAARQRAR